MGRSFSSKKKIPGSTASVFIVFLFCLTACGPVEESHSPELDRIMVDALAGQGIAGAVLLVARGGDTLHYRAYGHAERYSYDGAGLASPVPMQTGHVFDLASLTKVYATTFALMLLADSGLIRPDDPVTDYLPDYPDDKNGILIRHLLNHTSGLLPWQPVFLFDRNDDPASARAWIAASPLQSTPGEERAYSDLGFMTLGYVVEEVSGQPLDRFLADELYGRLGLNHTGFNPLSAGITPLVSTSHGNPFEIRMIDDDDFGYFVDGSSAQ
ncbi:MAG: serine hydrolase domain-containing protein, partial [Balneolales bacterium]